jgi:hypothetical protein
MGIKYFCDRCDSRYDDDGKLTTVKLPGRNEPDKVADLCKDCLDGIRSYVNPIPKVSHRGDRS